MSGTRLPRRRLLIAICSIWPLVLPMLWYTASLRSLRNVGSPVVIASLPEGVRATSVRLNTAIESMLVRAAVKLGFAILLLSAAVCFAAAKRMENGASARAVAAGVTGVALLLGVVLVMASVIRGDFSFSQAGLADYFRPTLFPAWCVLAAGLSFVVAYRYRNAKQEAA